MSNIVTQLILFKRYQNGNKNIQNIDEINNEIANRRKNLNERINAHNRKVAENKANAQLQKSTRIINKTVINNNVNMF